MDTNSRIKGLKAPVARRLEHRRAFTYEVFEREDGLWDIDAQMQDHKTHDITVANQPRRVGEALHDMVLRLTFDNRLTIVEVEALTQVSPYGALCAAINPAYQNMIGLNVLKGFRTGLKERFANVKGCTHITELANTLPTVAIQGIGVALAIRARQSVEASGEHTEAKPFQLDACHALASDAEAVRLFYPQWYLGTDK
ncbi:MAG: DUF2889 domain-containing protein [Formosimonas sp.]|jgi:hypothetical protein